MKKLNNEDRISYLANVMLVAIADYELLPVELKAIELIKSEIGATDGEFRKALKLIQQKDYSIVSVGCYSQQIRNFEDMVFVAMVDKKIDPKEQKCVLEFAKSLKLKQDQINIVIADTKKRISAFNNIVDDIEKPDKGMKNDIRRLRWGMSKSEVKKSEEATLYDDEVGRLLYEGTVINQSCIFICNFEKDQLVDVMYIFKETHTNDNLYITDYDSLKENLIKKYGNPDDYFESWSNDLYKDDPSHWGQAVSTGDLSYLTIWQTARTEVHHFLHGDKYEISHSLTYKSKLHDDIVDKARDEKILDEL